MKEHTWQRRSGIMLCYPFEEKRLKRWDTPAVYVQPKLNGDRCRIIVYPNHSVTLLSSEENEINSVPHINFTLEKLQLPPCELDGELYVHGMPHQNIHGIVGREVNLHENFEQMQFHFFDLPLDEPMVRRVASTEAFYNAYLKGLECIRLVPTQLVPATAENVIERMLQYAADGYEGIIVRSPYGHYERRRSIDIMKFKPHQEDTYLVIGYEQEHDKDGVPKESLGALILQSDENQIFKVGSGSFLTRENRRLLWEQRQTLKGRTARVKYQQLTNRRVPCFPVLIELLSIQSQETKCASGAELTTAQGENGMPVGTHTRRS